MIKIYDKVHGFRFQNYGDSKLNHFCGSTLNPKSMTSVADIDAIVSKF